jgi:hypothetical protein
MRFLNAVSVVLGSVRVCGRVAALGGATGSAAGSAGRAGLGFGFCGRTGVAVAAGRADWVAGGATDVVALVLGAFPVAAQPARAPAASTAPIFRHLTNGKIPGSATPNASQSNGS